MDKQRVAGFRVVKFSDESKLYLQEVADLLAPRGEEIVRKWIYLQLHAWPPHGIEKPKLKLLFTRLLECILKGMKTGELENCIADLEDAGTELAKEEFPYEALIISLHFLEESYMPILLESGSARLLEWLITVDEFLHLGIAALATSYFQHLRKQLLAEEKISQVVQEALMPTPPKKISDIEIGHVYSSATDRARLGGDFLDVFRLGDKRAAFVIGDLSGHGLDAAAESATIRSQFRGFIKDNPDLGNAMSRLNAVLVDELQDMQFVTALAGIYEPTGRLRLINAGGPPPIVCTPESHRLELTGLPLGIDAEYEYAEIELELGPREALVCYTDGVSEARDGSDVFGEERVIETVNQICESSAGMIAEYLRDHATRHAKGRLLDDMAVLALKRHSR